MKIKESKSEQPELTTAVSVKEETAVALKSETAFSIGGMSGEIDRGDLAMPKINIVQSVGPLSEDFKPGSILYNKEIVLAKPSDDPKEWTEPVEVTVLSVKKQYQEVTDYDSDEQGRIVDSMEEVEAAGGWIDWRNDEKPPWRPMLTALCMVKAPNEDLAERFTLAAPTGDTYELALWIMTGTSYTRAGKQIMTAGKYSLKSKETGEPELHKGIWHLQVRREKLGANLVYVPKLVLKGRHDEDFVEFASSLL